MLINERQELIISLLHQHQTQTLQQLVEATNSSESTIRRDLTELEKLRKLDRIHGGATISNSSLVEKSLHENSIEHQEEKKKIAEIAATRIEDGDCIFIDAGSTMLQLLPLLKGKKIVVVTNGVTHLEFLHELGITTYLVGGLLKASTQAFVGTMAVQTLQQYHFDSAFIGVNGFSEKYGYTTADPEEASVKRQAIIQAKKTYALADYSKYHVVKFSKISNLQDITLITAGLNQAQKQNLEKYALEVLQHDIHSDVFTID
ncbi:MAG: DeoR/GlpR transcriptional regulator [Kurthia sp.]|nr:DeoR/GlpR transcriptional regulator [Candidatus Kurthia equi]